MATTECQRTNDVQPETAKNSEARSDDDNESNADRKRAQAQHAISSVLPGKVSQEVNDASLHDNQPAATYDKDQLNQLHFSKIEDGNRCREAMGRRWCLLLHDAKDNDNVFVADCEAMQEVLQRDRHKDINASPAVKAVSTKEFEAMHLDFIVEVESNIFQKLVKAVEEKPLAIKSYDSCDAVILLYYIYFGFRLIKASDLLRNCGYVNVILPDNERVTHTGDSIDLCFEQVFERWIFLAELIIFAQLTVKEQSHVLRILMQLSVDQGQELRQSFGSNDCLSKTILELLWELIDTQKRKLKKLEDDNGFSEGTLSRLADLLFSNSVYATGFVNDSPLRFRSNGRWAISPDFRLVYNGIRKNFRKLSHVENANLSPSFLKFIQSIIDHLKKEKTMIHNWLWIHYSGHNMPISRYSSRLPDLNLKKIFALCLEYFSNVVISLDCCYPDVTLSYSSVKHVTCLFAVPPDSSTSYQPLAVLSYFTRELCSVLNGCDPETCPFTNDGTVPCDICTQLQREIRSLGFVFPSHVKRFFLHHKSNRDIGDTCAEPLVSFA